jgi:hypothetical protein
MLIEPEVGKPKVLLDAGGQPLVRGATYVVLVKYDGTESDMSPLSIGNHAYVKAIDKAGYPKHFEMCVAPNCLYRTKQ